MTSLGPIGPNVHICSPDMRASPVLTPIGRLRQNQVKRIETEKQPVLHATLSTTESIAALKQRAQSDAEKHWADVYCEGKGSSIYSIQYWRDSAVRNWLKSSQCGEVFKL